MEAKAFSFTHRTKVCGRHGREEQGVTSGGLAESAGGTGVSEPISASETASEARSVVGRLTVPEMRRKLRDRVIGDQEWVGEGSRRRWSGRKRKPDE